jgi:hypothetical protein
MHYLSLQEPLPDPFAADRYALLPRIAAPTASARCLIPDHYRRWIPRPVSYYALFKWWLLLSQHPGCHCNPTSFRTEHRFGTLAGGLDCSPFDDGYCHSPSISQGLVRGIRSLVEVSSRVDPDPHPVALPPRIAP